MPRKAKYTEDMIRKVHDYINNLGLVKQEAIKKAGFSDPSLYYKTLRRLDLKETIGLEKQYNTVSFI